MLRDDLEAQPATAPAFRFDASNHEYLNPLTGEVISHITELLERAGAIDDRWYTEESSVRGTAAHRLSVDYDLGAIDDPKDVESNVKAYFLAYVEAVRLIRPEYSSIEQARVHPVLRFGGRPDRGGLIYNARGVLEIKTGQVQSVSGPARLTDKAHRLQTAMQAILIAPWFGPVPARELVRWVLYLKSNGKFSLRQHDDKRDFDEAQEIIRTHAA
jgi:hypothetical protein